MEFLVFPFLPLSPQACFCLKACHLGKTFCCVASWDRLPTRRAWQDPLDIRKIIQSLPKFKERLSKAVEEDG